MKKDWEYIKVCAMFIIVGTIMLVICVTALLRIQYPDWMVYAIGYLAFGGMAFMGISTFITSIKQRNIKPNENNIFLTGTIIDHKKSKNKEVGEHRKYLPIYEYYVNGEAYCLISDVATAKNGRDIGDRVQIVYNRKTDRAFCLEDAKRKKNYGIIFFFAGLGAVALITLKIIGVL